MTDTPSVASHHAKTHFAQLLDRVERGEELTITRHGRPVARLAPISACHDVEAARRAFSAVFAYREKLREMGVAPFKAAEIRELRDAGRRH
ncbi:MAG TPA: type II toxin-antitoxin system prevent-host-death family antitoxin [Caulobacteraceae bacterium]